MQLQARNTTKGANFVRCIKSCYNASQCLSRFQLKIFAHDSCIYCCYPRVQVSSAPVATCHSVRLDFVGKWKSFVEIVIKLWRMPHAFEDGVLIVRSAFCPSCVASSHMSDGPRSATRNPTAGNTILTLFTAASGHRVREPQHPTLTTCRMLEPPSFRQVLRL